LVLPLCWDCCRLVKRAHPVEIVKEGFFGRLLNAVDIYSRVADLAIATSPNHVCGRVHVRQAFDTRQWNQRRRASDCRVPLDACLCWRWDVVPMLPRLHRYEVCLRAPNLPRPVHCKTKDCLPAEKYSSGRTAPRVRLQVWRVRCWLLWRVGTMPRMRTQIARALSCLCRPNPYDPTADVLPLLEWYIRSAETSATSVLGRMGHGDTVMRVSCSFVKLSIACHGAVSRHGELRATRMLRDSGLYVAARCPSGRVLA